MPCWAGTPPGCSGWPVLNERFRAFVALPLPPEVQAYLQAVQLRLNGRTPGLVRWVGSEGMHLTLKFLGDTHIQSVEHIETLLLEVASAHPPLTLTLSAMGCFPSPQSPRVVWAGLTGEGQRLAALYADAEAGLVKLGFAPELRPFAPHVTLGRVRDRVAPADAAALGRVLQTAPRLTAAPPVRMESVVLFKSVLTPQGAVYEHLVTAPLRGHAERGTDGG